MDLETKFKKETGFDAYADNDLRPKVPSDYYVEWLEEQLTLTDVSQQRELLNAFQEYYQNGDYNDEYSFEENQNRFLKAFNCG
jgi:nucleoid-associated protein YejK